MREEVTRSRRATVSIAGKASIGFPFSGFKLVRVFFTCAVKPVPVAVVARLEVLQVGVTVASVEGLGILTAENTVASSFHHWH